MEIEAIGRGSAGTAVAATSTSAINQEEFVKLFIAQLQFQDPLEPLDNREFMAQLAQFSNIEQNRVNGEQLESINFSQSIIQGFNLFQKTVEVETSTASVIGKVNEVRFTEDGPRLSVGSSLEDVKLSQIKRVSE